MRHGCVTRRSANLLLLLLLLQSIPVWGFSNSWPTGSSTVRLSSRRCARCRESSSALWTRKIHMSTDSQGSKRAGPEMAQIIGETRALRNKPQVEWAQHWYPVALTDELDAARANQVFILGKKMVLWFDRSDTADSRSALGVWRAMDAECPHRLADLSYGKVKQGNLVCRYHGWHFSADGECTKAPGHPMCRPASARRLVSYPTQEKLGAVWVWPDNGASRFVDSCLVDLPIMPELTNKTLGVSVESFGDIDMVIENEMDPLHAMFLHENAEPFLQPSAAVDVIENFELVGMNSKTAFFDENVNEKAWAPDTATTRTGNVGKDAVTPLSKEGFVVRHQGYGTFNLGWNYTRIYFFPASFAFRAKLPTGATLSGQFIHVPTRPGRLLNLAATHFSAPLAGSGSTVFSRTEAGSLLARLWSALMAALVPTYVMESLKHLKIVRARIAPQDSLLLRDSARSLSRRQRAGEFWGKSYGLAQSDYGIVQVRRWFDRFSSGGVDWSGEYAGFEDGKRADNTPMGVMAHEKSPFMDPWELHVKNCRHCKRTALLMKRILSLVQPLSIVVAAIAALGGALLSPALVGLGVAGLATLLWVREEASALFASLGGTELNVGFPE